MSEVLQTTLSNINTLQEEVHLLFENILGELANENLAEKIINRNFAEFCTSLIEKACHNLSKEEATRILCEQISAKQDLQGKQLAELIAQHMKTLESDDQAITLERSLSSFALEDAGAFGNESDIQH